MEVSVRSASLTRLIVICAAVGLSVNAFAERSDPAQPDSIVDIHVHTAGIGARGSGCYIAPALRDSYKFRWYLRAFGVSRGELESSGDAIVFQRIAESLEASLSVQQAVVLAMDGVVDEHGALDKSRTQVYVPNDFVQRETDRYETLLFGASVNPYRSDAIDRVDYGDRPF